MWAKIKDKTKEFTAQIKSVKAPAVPRPNVSGMLAGGKNALSKFAAGLEPKHLIYFALILLPAIVGLGAYYGIIDSQAKLEEANLPENQLSRMSISFTADDFVKYAGRGEKEITALFLEAGMSPASYRKSDGYTPLHAAAAYGRIAVVRQLLEKGADINARDKDGQTALMKAVWNSHADVAAALLQKGANITASDSKGNNVVSMAKTRNDRRTLDILVRAGVKELQENLNKLAPADKKPEPLPNTSVTKPQVAQVTQAANTKAGAANAFGPSSPPPGDLVLASGYAGAVGIGKSVDNLYQQFGQQAVVAGEEYLSGYNYPVLRAYHQGSGLPSLTVFFAKSKQGPDKVVTAIRVLDDRYKTATGIGVGGTLGELRRAGNISSIQYTDSLYAIAKDSKMRYELDISADNMPVAWLNGGDSNTLPDDMKIRSIYIF